MSRKVPKLFSRELETLVIDFKQLFKGVTKTYVLLFKLVLVSYSSRCLPEDMLSQIR